MFASEIKSILPLIDERKPNNQVIYDYLIHNRTDYSKETFFDGINIDGTDLTGWTDLSVSPATVTTEKIYCL